MQINLDRRRFLSTGLSAGVFAGFPGLCAALANGDTLFGTAFREQSGKYGFALLTENGTMLYRALLPSRGHDVVFDISSNRCVTFARRPGNFALVADTKGAREPVLFHCPGNRHFYGHGAFSSDGKLLYSSENDFENAAGKIGIYDATNNFSRIGEFPSYGIGPHELILDSKRRLLIVANGGIETHPEFGRRKLNLATMQPSLVYIDLETGDLLEIHRLNTDDFQLSIRHLVMAGNLEIYFACQNEAWFPGAGLEANKPLIGTSALGDGIKLFESNHDFWVGFKGYIGSIKASQNGNQVAVSSPKGNLVCLFDGKNRKVLRQHKIEYVSGLARSSGGFTASSASGYFDPLTTGDTTVNRYPDLNFENHVSSAVIR